MCTANYGALYKVQLKWWTAQHCKWKISYKSHLTLNQSQIWLCTIIKFGFRYKIPLRLNVFIPKGMLSSTNQVIWCISKHICIQMEYWSIQKLIEFVSAFSLALLFEVNLAPSVNKMLSNCDDIIRQHKAACLRVTSLLACKDLIWIGTSAGVILTIPAASCKSSGSVSSYSSILDQPIVTGT